jgi:hypothetical protein
MFSVILFFTYSISICIYIVVIERRDYEEPECQIGEVLGVGQKTSCVIDQIF